MADKCVPKFVQVSVARSSDASGNSDETIVAVDVDGRVWRYVSDWRRDRSNGWALLDNADHGEEK